MASHFHVCDPYELGLLAALAKALPLERQPKSIRGVSASEVGKKLARENIANVAYADPGRGPEGVRDVFGPSILDQDVVKLAGASALCFSQALGYHDHVTEDGLSSVPPVLGVTPGFVVAHANYVARQCDTHPGWKESVARQVCHSVENNAGPEALDTKVLLAKEPQQWGFSKATWAKLVPEILPDALATERIEAEGECARARARLQYPIYGYCIVDRDGSRGPLGVVRDPKHCAQVAVRMNDARDPAVNGPYRMVEMRAVPAHDHPPFGRDEHTLGYGIVSAECPLVQAEDGRTSGELIYDGLAGVLEAVRLRNVDATGDLTGTKGPWSAVELRAAPMDLERVREFAQPDAHDLDVATARGKVLGLRDTETPHIIGTLVGVAHKLRALAIREADGLLTTLVAPDGNSLANFKGLFGKGPLQGAVPVRGADPAACSPDVRGASSASRDLEEITASVRERVGERIELQVMSPTIILSTLGDSIYEGRAPVPPIPWESVNTMRIGAGDRFMGEVLGVHHFPETKGNNGKPYTAAVEMRLGHPLLRRAEYSPEPVLLVADMRTAPRTGTARWQRADGDLAEFGEAKPGDVIDVQMDVAGKTFTVRAVERELGADGAIRFAGQEAASPSCSYPLSRERGHAVVLGRPGSGKSTFLATAVAEHVRSAKAAAREDAPATREEAEQDEDLGR